MIAILEQDYDVGILSIYETNNIMVDPLRVLIVEDQAFMQEVTKAIIEKLGHTGFIAKTGFEALELLAKESYDLILMDVKLPDIDGMEVTRRFRESNQVTPVIAFTQELGAEIDKAADKENRNRSNFISNVLEDLT